MNPKSGIYTSEFWLTLVGKIMVFVVSLGLIAQTTADSITSYLTAIIGGVFGIVAMWQLAQSYQDNRVGLKRDAAEAATLPAIASNPAIKMLLAAVLLGLFAGDASAQLLPYRRMAERNRDLQKQINDLQAQLNARGPAAQPIIIQQPAPAPAAPAPAPQVVLIPYPVQAPGGPPRGGPPVYSPPLGQPPVFSPPLGGPPVYSPPVGSPPVYVPPIGVAPPYSPGLGSPPIYVVPPGVVAPVSPPGTLKPVSPPGSAAPAPYVPPLGAPAPGPTAMQRFAIYR